MKKLKLIPGLILLALCLAVLGVGIYAAAPASNTITGTVSVTAANAEVSIALYDTPTDYNPDAVGYQFGDGTTKKGNTRTGLSLSYSAVEFDASSANALSDVAPVTKLIVVKNNSTTKHLGVYFQDKTGSNTIHSSDPGWVSGGVPEQATMTYDNNYDVTASDILYGNVTTHYNASALNNVVQLNCSFYSHLAPSATVEMLVQFRLIDLDSTVASTSLNLYLNVEEYQPSDSDETEGFVKWDPGDMPVDANSVIGPESGNNAGMVDPNAGGGDEYDPYSFYENVLVALVIPSSVTSLENDGVHGFMHNCTKLVAVSIPNSVTIIKRRAFADCGLSSVIIPRSVTSIVAGDMVLRDGSGCLTTIIVDPNNETYDSRGGCNAIITKVIVDDIPANTLIIGCGGTVVPNTVLKIGTSAFSNTKLASITIASSVTSIGNNAFSSCTRLNSITIPSSVTSIGNYAFMSCTSLTSVTFENTTGWSYSSNSDMSSPTALSSSDLANPSTAATYLKTTYANKYWARSN